MVSLRASAALSQLAIIDVQTKLVPAMLADAMPNVTRNIGFLAQAAQLLQVPVLITEQYPQGLGATLPEVAQHVPSIKAFAKTVFSAYQLPTFKQHCVHDKPQLILTGMETHICILQTALDLIEAGKQVFVVEDAVISRTLANKANAIARMRDAGCVITNTESVLFEWLGKAEGDAFKTIAKLIR
jgi:nicotinamidase-related amidase